MSTPIERIRALLAVGEKATPGPWENDDPSWKEMNDITVWAPKVGENGVPICNMGTAIAELGDVDEAQQNFDNGAFVAAAGSARPDIALLVKLVDAVKRLRDCTVAADRAEDFPDANRRWHRAQDDLASARRQVDAILAELEAQQ